MILRHLFSPLNNTRLSNLCGPTDEHLRTISQALDIRIAHRHEQFKIEGPKARAQQGMELLQALYEIAARPIAPSTVQLMLTGDGAAGAADGPSPQGRPQTTQHQPSAVFGQHCRVRHHFWDWPRWHRKNVSRRGRGG